MFWQNWYKSNTDIDGKYTELEATHILSTLKRLHDRISERFPESGLRGVVYECTKVAEEVERLLKRLSSPIWPIRVLIWGSIALIVTIVIGIFIAVLQQQQSVGIGSWADFFQATEAGVNDLIFLAIAFWFIGGLEIKAKRQAILKSLHRLRSIAHVIDMHQLTKDPAILLMKETHDTASSPERTMTAFELTRYLDYCSEMLSLVSKLAALHAQQENDSVVLEAVNDVESLAQGLSAKIWQKLTMLEKEL